MSGRAGYFKTSRKTPHRTLAHDMPDYRLVALLPGALTLKVRAGAPLGIIGASIEPGARLVVIGKRVDFIWRQAAAAINMLGKGGPDLPSIPVTLSRGDEPPKTSGAPARGGYSRAYRVSYMAGPGTLVPRAYDEPLIFPG